MSPPRKVHLADPDQLLRRADAARAAAGGAGLQGSLADLPLPDLLQILAVNRKTGRLELERDGARAEIALVEGRVEDATAGAARGEKALFRLLSWRGGGFAFAPGTPRGPRRIQRGVEELLLEGLRQADEAARLLPTSPAADERLALAVAGAVPQGLHPVTAEVVSLLARPRSVQEVLDAAAASDLEALRAVAALLACGYARREPPAAAPRPLLAAEQVRSLRRRMERCSGRSGSTGKVILAGGGPLARRSALVRLCGLPGFAPHADGAPVAFGTLGRLALADGFCVDLVALPSDPALAPVWQPFAAGAFAALVLLPAEDVAPRVASLARELPLALGVCGPSPESVEAALGSAPGGFTFLGGDPAEALLALLALAAAAD